MSRRTIRYTVTIDHSVTSTEQSEVWSSQPLTERTPEPSAYDRDNRERMTVLASSEDDARAYVAGLIGALPIEIVNVVEARPKLDPSITVHQLAETALAPDDAERLLAADDWRTWALLTEEAAFQASQEAATSNPRGVGARARTWLRGVVVLATQAIRRIDETGEALARVARSAPSGAVQAMGASKTKRLAEPASPRGA